MELKIFTVYDSKTEAYLQPFFMQNKGACIRAITETVQNPEHQFAKYPEDFTLFEVGIFDDNTCKFDLHKTPISMGVLVEFKRQQS